MHTGSQTRIGTVVPKLGSVKATVTLSKPAKLRLQWVDYYHAHRNNARLTCRHFGIAHRTFYRYYNRFKLQGLVGLEARSERPKHVRTPTTPTTVIDLVRSLRKTNPELSKYKLAVILKRDHGYSLSASSVGRIISRYDLFFNPPVQRKGHPGRQHSIARIRKPKELVPTKPGELVEIDVKHIPCMNEKRYGFVTLDVFTKQASIYVGTTISATQGALAWKRARHELGLPDSVRVLNDNGSENLGAFAKLLEEQHITQYFARPRTPKDKPHVERFIGSLERECLQWGGVAFNKQDQQDTINTWLKKYHSYRPHQALGYLTPDEYKAKLQAEEVALM
jgi:transposase InsO family protein